MKYELATNFVKKICGISVEISTPFSPCGIARWRQASTPASAPDGTSTEEPDTPTGPELSSGSEGLDQAHASRGWC